MLQDIYPHKLHNEYQTNRYPMNKDVILSFDQSKLWIKSKAEYPFIKVGDIGEAVCKELNLTYLFSLDQQAFFLWNEKKSIGDYLQNHTNLKVDMELVELRSLKEKTQISHELVFAAYTAKHLADWYRDNQFCGRCGQKMEHSKTERAMTCSCGYTSYPRIMPAVIVGVINHDKMLITKYRTGYRHSALIAGFTEIGETIEETVAREVMEETGICVKNIRYYKSQPWGIANDILVGYYCDLDGDETIKMDENELGYAEWTRREDIVLQPDNISLTNEMMSRFKNGEIC